MRPTCSRVRVPLVCLSTLLVLLGLAAIGGTSSAAIPPAQAQSLTAAADEGDGRMVLVLDSSGSMAEPAEDGQSKMQAAKEALAQVIGGLPPGQPVGLRVYGSEVFSRSDPGACTDTELAVPVGTGNRNQMRAAVRGFKPYGETPIGNALLAAAEDLGNEGPRTIVLVSDGEATCAPDPCEVAADLAKKGIDLKIDVVGLGVTGEAREQMACIAERGHGTYYDARDADDLAASLDRLAERALRPFKVSGEPVAGTPSAAGAPTITAGNWVDDLGPEGRASGVRTYVVQREVPGSTLHLSATITAAANQADAVMVEASSAEGMCVTDNDFRLADGTALLSAGVGVGPDSATTGSASCAEADEVVLTVRRGIGSAPGYGAGRATPVEIRITEEPPVIDTSGLPPSATDGAWKPPRGAGRATVELGGSSFADAPLIEPGRYRGDIVPGEVQVFLVDVGWGQHVQATLDVARPKGELAAAVGSSGLQAAVNVFNPYRAKANLPDAGQVSAITGIGTTGRARAGVASQSVAYMNRTSTDEPTGAASQAGTYAVVVSITPDPDGDVYQLPFTLDVAVAGTVAGEPTYAEPSEPTEPTDTATTEPTDSATTEPTDSPTTEEPDADSSAAADTDDEGSSALLVGALVAAAVLVLGGLLAAGTLARRRRA